MLAIVEMSSATGSRSNQVALSALAELAARHEVVLICDHGAVINGLLPALRNALPRRQLLALIIDGHARYQECEVIKQALKDGRIPIIVTIDAAGDQPIDWQWIGADGTLRLAAVPAAARQRVSRNPNAAAGRNRRAARA